MPAKFPEVDLPPRMGNDCGLGDSPVISDYIVNGSKGHADDIVISGMSARMPDADDLHEFRQKLFGGVDMVAEDDRRWPRGMHGLPLRSGKLKDLSKFDANFFGVHAKQAKVMDPQLRLLLEVAYEAIVDAGVNPTSLRGSRTGVYVGVSNSESNDKWLEDPDAIGGYELIGCCRAMFANRVSFTFDFKGPSLAVDTACSSGLMAMEEAVTAMRAGQCDAAIVAGTNLVLNPASSLQFHRLGMLAKDGKCKSFSDNGDGYVRSESVTVLFLQRSGVAHRVYGTVVHIKSNADGNKKEGVTYPSGAMQKKLLQEIYSEAGVDPKHVVYVESHGTGTKVGDPEEMNAIADVFCKNRNGPLLIGSLKSNMGHPEPVSGLCGVAKVLLSMELGELPPNLHFTNPNPNIHGLLDGRLKVVAQRQKWNTGLVGVSSFGFGGSNVHVILKPHTAHKNVPPLEGPPTVVPLSGRTEEALKESLMQIGNHPSDPEYAALLHQVSSMDIQGHPFRGYTLLNSEKKVMDIQRIPPEKPPVWFVCSGMGAQWTGMAKELLQFEVFEQSMRKSATILQPHGFDLYQLIVNGDEDVFDTPLNSFVGIAAMQVALLDMLSVMGIHPDGIVGHSVGEVACAYADGCFTHEQAVLTAYWRGRAIQESKLPTGRMASVGLNWKEVQKQVPKDVAVACHNSEDNTTISGMPESVRSFVEQLDAKGVFAKEVKSAGIAFHSTYIAEAGPKLRKSLDQVIPNPKPRSPRWVSTSIPESSWNLPLAKTSSAAYHVNNLLSPVLFEEALRHVPEGAVVIEVAPHCLLQPIVKRVLKTCTLVGLMKRNNPNNSEFFLNAVGRLYLSGLVPKVAQLYKSISFPVSRSTPMISPIVRWDHSVSWDVADFSKSAGSNAGEHVVQVNLKEEQDKYVEGHKIDGRILFPATGYMVLAWKTLAKLRGSTCDDMPVIFEDVTLERATIMNHDNPTKFSINMFEGTGDFQIQEGGSVAVRGRIRVPEDISQEFAEIPDTTDKNGFTMQKEDVYKELRLRGYEYSGLFQGVLEADGRGLNGKLEWSSNWVSFLDTMLQFTILGKDSRSMQLPTRLLRMVVDPKKHSECIEKLGGEGVPAKHDKYTNTVQAGGVEIRGMKASPAPRRQNVQAAPSLEKYRWEPYVGENEVNGNKDNLDTLVKLLVDIVIENTMASKLKIVEAATGKELISPFVVRGMQVEPMNTVDGVVATGKNTVDKEELEALGLQPTDHDLGTSALDISYDLAIGHNASGKQRLLANLTASVRPGGFVLLYEDKSETSVTAHGLALVAKRALMVQGEHRYLLLLRRLEEAPKQPLVVHVDGQDYGWVEEAKVALLDAADNGRHVVLMAQDDPYNGLVGLATCLRRESGGENLRCFLLPDKSMPAFDLARPEFGTQLRLGLLMNVAHQGQWGSYRHMALGPPVPRQVPHAYANVLTRGDLASLRWIQGPIVPTPGQDQGLCKVHYAPLNFRDVMLASGKLPPDALPGNAALQDCLMGLEFSGCDAKGKQIMGLVEARGLGTIVRPDPNFTWDVPSSWTLEEASTVPVVYATAYYALLMRGHMKPGESLLVHSGSGGVGQAAISIALSMGCRVFTTVGSESKRAFLRSRFPQLTEENFANSRDTTFEQHVMRHTAGKGVDLVLNSLSEDKLQASLRCLAQHGRFLEIGKFDLANNNPLGMSLFLKNITFHGVLLDSLFEDRTEEKKELVRLVKEGVAKGVVKPLACTVFEAAQLEEAFRFMASGKHMGKVVVRIRQGADEKIPEALPRTHLDENKTYVILGGLGGFGLELAGWMVERGARRLVLTGRRGVRNGFQALSINRWRQKGVEVTLSQADAGTQEGARKLLTEANKLGPVGGIINSALVLRDGLMNNQSQKAFQEVAHPKAQATILLDQLSRKMCPTLDHFVVFSSVSCGRGNVGQANYGLANSVMERVCEKRRRDGLPALAVQWGAVGDVGVVSETMGGNDIVIGGTLPQRISSCLASLDLLLQQPEPVVSSIVIAEKQGSRKGSGNQVSLLAAVGNILGMKDITNVDHSNSLGDLGLDSLMGVEVKQLLEREQDLVLGMQEIRKLTIASLIDLETSSKPGKSAPESSSAASSQRSPFQSFVGEWMGENELGTLKELQSEELLPTKCIVQMKSVPKANLPVAFLVHSIEGVARPLTVLADNLKCTTYAIQCTEQAPLDSVPSLATYYLKQMRNMCPKGPYLLAGYSYGATVAFEMALQLQKEAPHLLKNLILLDGSHDFVATQVTDYYRKFNRTEDDAETVVDTLTTFLAQFCTFDFTKMKADLMELSDRQACLQHVASILADKMELIPEKDIMTAAELFYQKLVAAGHYKPSVNFNGHALLVRALDNASIQDENYALNTVCNKKVAVHAVEGDHRSFLRGANGKKVASILNSLLV